MKSFLVLVGVLILSSCSTNSHPSLNSDSAAGVVDPASAPAKKTTTENFDIIANDMKSDIEISSKYLDVADKIAYQKFELGTEISISDCKVLSSKLCPEPGDDSVKIYVNRISEKNSFGIEAAAVLSIETPKDLKQYLLTAKDEMIESEDSQSGITSVSCLNEDGDEISRTEKVSDDKQEAFIFRSESKFSSGTKIEATRARQNDSIGKEIVITSIKTPTASVRYVSDPNGGCSYGVETATDKTREFGDIRCSTQAPRIFN